jgi:ethylmalonyl-CoA/methylmalonyl-CoA decarboxylase
MEYKNINIITRISAMKMSRTLLFCRSCSNSARVCTEPLQQEHAAFLSKVDSWLTDSTKSGSITLNRHTANENVAILRINNPSKRGSISGNMMLDLAKHVDTLEQERPTAVIFASTGPFFSSGLDLNLAKGLVNTPEMGLSMCNFMTDALNRIRSNNSISVCVINSPALGGGMELITATDFRIMRGTPTDIEAAEEDVTKDDCPFIQSVHAKIGASPGWGGGQRLVSIIGRQKALSMLGSSSKVDPDQALAIGLADSLYSAHDNEDCTEVGLQFLSPFLKQKYPNSVRAMKEIVHAADVMNTSSSVEVEKSVFKERWFGNDNRHALGLK